MNIFKKALLVVLGAGLVVVPSTVDKVEAAPAMGVTTTTRLYVEYPDSWGNITNRRVHYWYADGANGSSWDNSYNENVTAVSTNSSFASVTTSGYGNYYIDMTGNASTYLKGLIPMFKQSGTLWRYGPNGSALDLTKDSSDNAFSNGKVYSITGISYTGEDGTKYYKATTKHVANFVELNANGGTINGKASIVVENKVDASISTVPTYGNNIFKGWKVEGSDDSTASLTVTPSAPTTYVAVWEAPATACEATFVVGDHSFKVIADKGTDISTIVPTAKLEENNLKVISWDKTGTLEGDTTINADKYYTELEKVSAQLYLDYTYKTTNVYLEYYPEDASKPDAVVTAKDSTTGSEKQFAMTEIKKPENGSKGLYLADVPVNYDLIKFTFTSNESDESKRNVVTEFLTRDFANNASWYNWSGDNNFFSYGSPYAQDIVAVENVKLRFTTTNLAASSFAGVETYGIRISLGETIADDDYYGPKWAAADVPTQDGNIIWSAAIENVTNYDVQFTAVPYVVIDGTSYDLCEARTLSVVDAANEYLSNVATLELDSKAQSALNYIIANA